MTERPALIPLGFVTPATVTIPIISLDAIGLGRALNAYDLAEIDEGKARDDLKALGVETALLEKMIARRRANHERRKW